MSTCHHPRRRRHQSSIHKSLQLMHVISLLIPQIGLDSDIDIAHVVRDLLFCHTGVSYIWICMLVPQIGLDSDIDIAHVVRVVHIYFCFLFFNSCFRSIKNYSYYTSLWVNMAHSLKFIDFNDTSWSTCNTISNVVFNND